MSQSAEDLTGFKCEWCDRQATLKLPKMKRIKGSKGMMHSGMYIYACYGHERIAKEVANGG